MNSYYTECTVWGISRHITPEQRNNVMLIIVTFHCIICFFKKSPHPLKKCFAILVFVQFLNRKTLVWEKIHFQNISAIEVYKSPCVITILICGLVVCSWCLVNCASAYLAWTKKGDLKNLEKINFWEKNYNLKYSTTDVNKRPCGIWTRYLRVGSPMVSPLAYKSRQKWVNKSIFPCY